ncbi:hypothetical protein EBS43_09330 [bacterium]|jgi:hypothetical protein|nr:hypothetical protein [bacterium]
MNLIIMHILILGILLLNSPINSWSKMTQDEEIKVTLLGQPCDLSGPFSKVQLKAIHSIGPAQLYPNLSPPNLPDTEKNARKALSTLTQTKHLPPAFDRYKQNLSQRLNAQIEFLHALNESQKALNTSPLLKIMEIYTKDKNSKLYEQAAKRLSGVDLRAPQSSQVIEEFFDLFNEEIAPDPEHEFHRALKKLNIQYKCSFEESED